MEERSKNTTCATDPAHATDAELVRDARQGGVAAFEALTARHFPMVYALAYARLGAREATEDLAQEVFLLATLHLGALTDPARFAAWLGRIARNEAGMWRRRSQSASRLVRLVPLDDLPAEPAAPAGQGARAALESDEETRALHEALFRLPEALREVVLLHYFEDLSKAEIAARLEVHPATVGRQIEKALQAMKRTLEPILRRAAPAFRHSAKAAARTTLLVGAVAAMSAPAKAALLAEAGASVVLVAAPGTTASIAQTATVWHTILTGGFIMSTKTQIAAVLIALALVAGVTYHQMAQSTPASKAPAPTATHQATPAAKELVVTAAATAPTTATAGGEGAPDQTALLSPGKAGAVSLGMDIDEVTKILGKPDFVDGTFYNFLPHGLQISMSESKKTVSRIMCLGPSFATKGPYFKGVVPYAGKTAEGIGIGSSKEEVIKAYGTPTRQTEPEGASGGACNYQNLGMLFVFDLSGLVDFIVVSGSK